MNAHYGREFESNNGLWDITYLADAVAVVAHCDSCYCIEEDDLADVPDLAEVVHAVVDISGADVKVPVARIGLQSIESGKG